MSRLSVLSFWKNRPAVEARSGTRVPCKIRLTLTGCDPDHQFSEPCLVVIVNPQGCGVKLGRGLEAGTRVRLEGLPGHDSVTAEVVHCTSLGEYEKLWFAGLSLDRPGNVWGIDKTPEDWRD